MAAITNEKGPAACDDRAPETTNESPDSRALSRGAAKRFRTAQADAALAGCELLELAGGGYLLSRWGLTRELRSIDEVQTMLAKMRGRA